MSSKLPVAAIGGVVTGRSVLLLPVRASLRTGRHDAAIGALPVRFQTVALRNRRRVDSDCFTQRNRTDKQEVVKQILFGFRPPAAVLNETLYAVNTSLPIHHEIPDNSCYFHRTPHF